MDKISDAYTSGYNSIKGGKVTVVNIFDQDEYSAYQQGREDAEGELNLSLRLTIEWMKDQINGKP